MPVVVGNSSYTDQGYIAPTVFLVKGGVIPRWNYYNSMTDAIAAFNKQATYSAGAVSFTSQAVPQTFGINVDFYVPKNGKWVITDYSQMKSAGLPNCVIRMYTPAGAGPVWSTFNRQYFGITATKVSETDPAKVAALDAFYREVALMKYRYNALVGFLNTLAQKQLTSVEQQVFNQGMVTLQNLNNQIAQIKGIEIHYTSTGAIGIPIILIIAIVAILSGVAAWTVTAIATEREKTKRINDAYDLSRWIAEKKAVIAAQVEQGSLTQSQANSIYSTLDNAQAAGNKIATESSKASTGIFGEVGGLLKWGVIGLIGFQAFKLIGQKRNANGTG